jgi:hypothetical protein
VEAVVSRAGLPVATVAAPGDQDVEAGRSEDLTLLWDTTDAVPGVYEVRVNATADGLVFEPLTTTFDLAPAGSAERSGTVESFEVVGPTEPGGTARLRAAFRNRSDVAVEAVLLVDVSANGDLLGQERSLPLLVPARRTAEMEVVVEDLRPARYEAVGKVNFDGRETETASADFDVRFVAAPVAGGSPTRMLLGVGLVGLVVAVPAVVVLRRRRGRNRGDDLDEF